MTQTGSARGGGGILLIGCGLHDSHITGPIRGRIEAHATTRPGAHRSGRPGKSGEPVGGPERSSGIRALNSGEVRVCQHPVAGRGTDGGRRPWAVPQSAAGHHRLGPGHGSGLDRGQSGKSPWVRARERAGA